MSISNLGDLRTEVQQWTTDSSTTFANRFPVLVSLAEDRIYLGVTEPREQRSPPIRTRDMETAADVAVTSGSGALPNDFLQARRLFWDDDPDRELRYVPPRTFHTLPERRFLVPQEALAPINFTIEGNTLLVSPASTGTIKLWYFQRFPALVNDADTNALLTGAPSLYLMATLVEAYMFKRDDARFGQTMGRYRAIAEGLSHSEQRGRISGAPLIPRISGAIA